MLYLMTVLTFLAGILFYILSPRDDKLHLDTYQAEPLIQDLITQHQAAKEYLRRWFGAHLAGKTDDVYFNLLGDFWNFTGMKKSPEDSMMCYETIAGNDVQNSGDYPAYNSCFLSRVICLNSSKQAVTCSSGSVVDSYVVTYGGWDGSAAKMKRPGWWPNENASRVRRNERWRRAIAQRTHGSLSCGNLYLNPEDENAVSNINWCLDNGQVTEEDRLKKGKTRCVKPIPKGIIDGLKIPGTDPEDKVPYLYDMFLCISPVVQGPAHYYPSGLTHYFDGLDNHALHAPASSYDTTHQTGSQLWYNLVSGLAEAGTYTSGAFVAPSGASFSETTPYLSLNSTQKIDFNISPGDSDFTISVVVALESILLQDSIISFTDGDSSHPSVSVDYNGAGEDGPQIEFHVKQNNDVWYKFFGSINSDQFKANHPFTLTMTRRGNEIALYMGGHQTLEASEKKLYSGVISDEVKTPFKTALNNKMFIKGDSTIRLYAVRYFNRGLGSDDVYKVYKEDLQRYGSSYITTYSTSFDGTIAWPKNEYDQNQYTDERTN